MAGDAADAPAVIVVMNCLNCERYLREAIDSVFAQTFDDWEIVFWDNASTDASATIAQSYGAKVRYFHSSDTKPLGRARNSALEQARGGLIAFLDCDDVWLPTKLERQVPLFEANPRVGLVFSNTVFFNERGRERLFYGQAKPDRGSVFGGLLVGYNLSMETVVIRRAALDSLGDWFDPRFEVIEEKDLFLRIAHDWEVDYVDAPLARWRVHGGSWTWNKKELFPLENELMLEKFASLYPGFETDYRDELSAVRANLSFRRALIDWEAGRGGEARRRLRPLVGLNRKILATYLLSFFPYAVYRSVVARLRVMP